MANTIQLRNDTEANWIAANPTLLKGEMGVATDKVPKMFKMGDGVTAWTSLPYFSGSSGTGSIRALKVLVTSNTLATITADEVALRNSLYNAYSVFNVNLTLNTATVGANGLDTGTLAASTWYYTYVICNTATGATACLMSLSSTAPTLPSGYTFYARVGALRTTASIYLYRTIQYGRKTQYIIDGTILTANLPVMASGTAVSTVTAIPVAAFVPPTSGRVSVQLNIISIASGGYGIAGPNSYITITNAPMTFINNTTLGCNLSGCADFILESANIYWKCSTAATSYVFCLGWEDNF